MIGKHYTRDEYNCAHFVAEWYRKHLNVEIPTVSVFDHSFVIWMRKHFTPTKKPHDHSLVLMTNSDGSYHVGIYYDYGVYHNYTDGVTRGAVCKWTLGSITNYYERVRYYNWST